MGVVLMILGFIDHVRKEISGLEETCAAQISCQGPECDDRSLKPT
jgi:hypothetical protein